MAVRRNNFSLHKRRIYSTINTTKRIGERVVSLGVEAGKRIRKQFSKNYDEAKHMQIMSAEKEKKKIEEIHKKILRQLGLNKILLASDRRFFAMATALYQIFGEKISNTQIKKANAILSKKLRVNSEILSQSPTLKNEIQKMKYGKISEKGQKILTQAVKDILEKEQML